MDATVTECRNWAAALLARVYSGPGSMEAALHRAEAKWGVEASTFWALRYRPPKQIAASVYLKLKAAYETEVQAQAARLRHELELAKALGDAPAALVDEAEALLRQTKGKDPS